jgi:hypothetical protein
MNEPVAGILSRVNASVVATLEQALEQARSGKMSGVCVVAAVGNETYMYKGGAFQRPRFVFAMEVAKLQMVQDALSDGELTEDGA